MSNRSVVPFDFHSHQLRVIPTEDGLSFWAVAKDVADILGHRDALTACRIVPDSHKGTHSVRTPGGTQELLCVDETGLYRLVMRSDKPAAEPFIEWVTAEVLPQIRRTGSYSAKSKLTAEQTQEVGAAFKSLHAEYRKAMAHIDDLTAQLKQAHSLALAADQRLERIAHYANKGLNGAEVAKLTDISETTTRRMMKRLRAAGVIHDLGDDGAMILSALGSGLDLFSGK